MEFWIKDPTILFNKDAITQIWPYTYLSYNEKLNAFTRFIIFLTLIGYLLLNNVIVIVLGLIVIGGIVLLFIQNNKEGMFGSYKITDQQKIEDNNPFSNVLMDDYKYNPSKKAAETNYSSELEQDINTKVKSFVIQENIDNSDIYNMFNNEGDKFTFEQSLRQFNTNPSTTIPNKQDDFLSFCYGKLPSDKPLVIY
jgi:hypothetical protein